MKATFVKVKITETHKVNCDQQDVIKGLEPAESYKYLAVHEGGSIKPSLIWEGVKTECYGRVSAILKTEPNARTKTE